MATRVAKYRFASMAAFLERWDAQLSEGSFFLSAEDAPEDLASEFRLDLLLPLNQRLGPFRCQVVHRSDDGGVGVQIPNVDAALQKDIDLFFDGLDEVKAWYVAQGDVVPAEDVPDVAELERQIAAQMAVNRQAAVSSGEKIPEGPRPRGFILPNIAGRKPDAEGHLDDRAFRDLLVELAIQRTSGLLTIVTADGTKRWGFWHKGGPVGWRTDPVDPAETLGVLLLKAKHITKEQLGESLQAMEDQNIRQGEALIEMGVLNFGQLVSVLEKQVEFVLQNVMQEKNGRWAFHTVDSFDERFVNPPVRVPSLLYRALRDHSREMPRERLMEKHRVNLDLYVHLTEETLEILKEIQFSTAESKFLEVIMSSSWRLRELFTVTNLSRNQTACVLWALDELHLIEYRGQEDLGRYLERISSRILAKVRTLPTASHFDVMEIHWICLQEDVEVAYDRLLEEFDASKYHDLTPELKQAIERIRKKVEEANKFLKVKKNRKSYREEIIEADTILNSAELLAKKGEMAIMKADGREAVLCWSKAVELIPQSKTFKDGLQRARGMGNS